MFLNILRFQPQMFLRGKVFSALDTNKREHEGTERDTPSPRFVICHSQQFSVFYSCTSVNGYLSG